MEKKNEKKEQELVIMYYLVFIFFCTGVKFWKTVAAIILVLIGKSLKFFFIHFFKGNTT